MTLSLSDTIPKRASFRLKQSGKHKLRPLNLADEIWLEDTFAVDGVMPNIADDMRLLSRAVYHQLEDKSPFKAQDVEYQDEDGCISTRKLGGYDLFLQSIIGLEEKIIVLNAWLECLGVSRPVQEELKKKILEL